MPLVIVRCDGSSALGMGHVSRCLALADELRDLHKCELMFLMREPSSAGIAVVRAAGYAVEVLAGDPRADYGEWLRTSAQSHGARAVVVDVRDALSRGALDACRRDRLLVVTIDDATDRRLASDLTFYPPVPQVEEMDWSAFTGKRFAGWDWVILRREFGDEQAGGAGAVSAAVDILITMGGSDPAGMTEFTIRALERLAMPLAVRVVIGPAFRRAEQLIDAIARTRHFVQVSRSPGEMAPLMRPSRLAICAFGVSAYELAACGVPAVHLCLTDDHQRSSSAFDKAGIARTAGVFGRITAQQLAEATSAILGDAGLRTTMSERARRLVDGRGASRVAKTIVAALRLDQRT